MRASLVAVAIAALACGGAMSRSFAGLTSSHAQALAVATFRTLDPPPDADQLVGAPVAPGARPLGTFRSLDAQGKDAWLTIFRYDGVDEIAGASDVACVWVRRVSGLPWRYSFDDVPTIVNGHATPAHERCLEEVRGRRLFFGDTVGSEIPTPAVAFPQPVSPLGPVPRGTFVTYPEDTTAISESGIPAKFPETTAPGTAGLAAFVLDARTLRPVRGAVVLAKRSTRLSAFRPAFDPRNALTAISDRHGAVAFLDLPASRHGYDFFVSAPGYAPYLEVHELMPPGLYAGDFLLGRTPVFEDEEPGPPVGSGR